MDKYKAYIDRIIDSETFEVTINLGFNFHYKCKVKLQGIKVPSNKQYEGLVVTEYVKGLIENKVVYIKPTNQNDKYGNQLANVMLQSGKDLGEHLIEQDMAKPYKAKKGLLGKILSILT